MLIKLLWNSLIKRQLFTRTYCGALKLLVAHLYDAFQVFGAVLLTCSIA